MKQKPVWLQEASQHLGPQSKSQQVCHGHLCTEVGSCSLGMKPMRKSGSMVSSENCAGLASDDACVYVGDFIDHRIRVRMGMMNSSQKPHCKGPSCYICELKSNDLPFRIAMDIFRAIFVDDLAICFHKHSLNTIGRHLQQPVYSTDEWVTKHGFRFAARKYKLMHFTAPTPKD